MNKQPTKTLILKKPELFTHGFHLCSFLVSEELKQKVQEEDWQNVDKIFTQLTSSEGALFHFLQTFHSFNSIEHMISLRDGQHEWEEDGIWHDDGSRVLAFSFSLTLDPSSLEGGNLGIKKKGDFPVTLIPTPPLGGLIIFFTGVHGFEHRIHQVQKGRRLIVAGWCS